MPSKKEKSKILKEKERLEKLLEEARASAKIDREIFYKEQTSLFGLLNKFNINFETFVFGTSYTDYKPPKKLSPIKNSKSLKIENREDFENAKNNSKILNNKAAINKERSALQKKEPFLNNQKLNPQKIQIKLNVKNQDKNSKLNSLNNKPKIPKNKELNLNEDLSFRAWLKHDFFFKEKLFKLLSKDLGKIKNILKNLKSSSGGFPLVAGRGPQGFGGSSKNKTATKNKPGALNISSNKGKIKTPKPASTTSFFKRGVKAAAGFFLGDFASSAGLNNLEKKETKRKKLNKEKESLFGTEKGEEGFLNSRALGYAESIGGEALKYASIGMLLGPAGATIGALVGGIVGFAKAFIADGGDLKKALGSLVEAVKSIWEFIKDIVTSLVEFKNKAVSFVSDIFSESTVGKTVSKVKDFFFTPPKETSVKVATQENKNIKEAKVNPVAEPKVTRVVNVPESSKIQTDNQKNTNNNIFEKSPSKQTQEKSTTVIANNYGNRSIFDELSIIHRNGGIDTINLIR